MDTIYYNAQDDEFWKNINDYEGLYMVSNLGRVKSLNYRRTGKEGMLKPRPNGDGYLYVKLCKNGEKSTRQVHRLVMRAFVGVCPEGHEVDHIDWNPKNNRLSNLRYLPAEENNSRKSPEWFVKMQKLSQDPEWRRKTVEANKKLAQDPEWLRKNAESVRKKCCKPVNQNTLDGQFVKRWPSAKDAARELGINDSNIAKCCNGKRDTVAGFKWQYATKI